jgi:hypothetical protein
MFCRKVLLPVEEGLYVAVLDGEDMGMVGMGGWLWIHVISVNMLKRVRCLYLS